MRFQLIGAAFLLALAGCQAGPGDSNLDSHAAMLDNSDGTNWLGYGRTYGEQHFSPLTEVDVLNVGKLGLAWTMDLEPGNPMSGPVAVDGVLYTSTAYSIVRAIDAANGKLLWSYDPKATQQAGRKMRQGWGSRGLAWWNGKIYVGTIDGRLIALDAASGKEVWSTLTVGKDDLRFITSAPRIFNGKIIIGHGGADSAATRGYVTTYDAETGKQLWRFYTVPGNPADGFEDEAQEMAAKTWTGEWWKHGGGGTVWNSFTYDPETDTVFLGTGNGAPWNQRVRSPGGGDNLFLCSIVALNATTGKYKWHYQSNPGETWDFNASMDMHLADIMIDGKPRKIIMQAPKNGFVYVIDRITGKFISADPIAKVTWATGIDPVTGRPIEKPESRYADGKTFDLWPSPHGAHTWLPSAFSPQSKLMYIPVSNIGFSYNDKGIDPKTWTHGDANLLGPAANLADLGNEGSFLLAWDPSTRKARWRATTPGAWTGGVLATGGNLVFQGQSGGVFAAYNAGDGKQLWSFDAKSPVLAPPITYKAGGKQYVTVLTGIGTSAGMGKAKIAMPVDYRMQARRILTFVLDGTARLPKTEPSAFSYVADPAFKPDPASAARGSVLMTHCFVCHSTPGNSAGTAPELGTSLVPQNAAAFEQIVRQGGMVADGMPRFEELTDEQLADLRQYIRTETRRLYQEQQAGKAK